MTLLNTRPPTYFPAVGDQHGVWRVSQVGLRMPRTSRVNGVRAAVIVCTKCNFLRLIPTAELRAIRIHKSCPNIEGRRRARAASVESVEQGQQFGGWVVVDATPIFPRHRVLVRCSCGRERMVRINDLTNGKSTRCLICSRKNRLQEGASYIQLSYDIAAEIRKRRAQGEKLLPIANDYGISTSAVSKICHNKTWRVSP